MTHVFPDNLLSHRASWLKALERLIELEPVSVEPDMDEKGFWRHEHKAMLDMYADVDAYEAGQQEVGECRYCANTGWFYGDPDLNCYCGCAFGKLRQELSPKAQA